MANRPHNFRALSKPKHITKKDQKHYWPYIPVLFMIISTFAVSLLQPLSRGNVLAYATNISNSGLLNATNAQRTNQGVSALKLNATLSSAATEKAKDMVARNYWSHNTPDGDEPWVFIQNVGYKYTKAGENLAYGFLTSDDTVVGWMNSPSHKANLLDSAFTEVGFGFANGENYNGNGNETVVVAMYAKPQVLNSSSSQPAPTTKPSSTPTPKPEESKPITVENDNKITSAAPVTTETNISGDKSTIPITRIQTITNGDAPWAIFIVGLVTGLSLMMLLAKHATAIRHLIKDSEKFILHHPLLDTVLVGLILIGTLLSQTSGFIL